MTASSPALDEAIELARSLDGSLAQILDLPSLLDATEHDRPLGADAQEHLLGLGWTGIAVSEEAGGLGLDDVAVVKLAAVAGRRLLPAAIRGEAFVLAPLLAGLAAEPAPTWLAELLAGERRGGGAVVDADGPDGVEATVALAPGATLAALVGPDWGVVVALDDPGVEVEPIAALEAGQGHVRLRLTGPVAPDRALSAAHAAAIRRLWELVVLAEAYGAAARMLEQSVEFATQREQFGRRIVTFQAVSHRLAKMATELESLDAGLGRLVAAGAASDPGLAAVLRHAVPAGCRTVCESAIQVHGGMGFTWEHGLHLYYRRILDLQYALGGSAETRRRAGARYLDERAARGGDDG
jgi:alkylation response protein AidB-like acyl-CoA dehydrogenase